jgi:hypothetical protein
MNWKTPIACAACLTAGAGMTWVGMQKVHRPAAAIAQRESGPAPRAGNERSSTSQAVTQAKLMRAIVREEVAGAVEEGVARAAADAKANAAAGAADDAGADDTSPEPTPSYTKTVAYVDDRLARGVWTESDRDEVSGALGSMTHEERMEVMARVIRAVNQDKLKVEARGPLF